VIDFAKGKQKILITSALPYANGSIHVGHLVEYIQTDIFVRFLKLIGEDAIYCCADDTHGTPIEIAAKTKGVLPEQLIGEFYKEHTRDFASFQIEFDSYYSTNSKENEDFSILIFNKLKENGLIYTKDVELAYCKKCKRFLPDRFIKGKCPKCNTPDQYGDICENCNEAYSTTDLIDPYCTICGTSPTTKESKHYFFKLSKCSKQLKDWLKNNKNLQPEIKNYLNNWIEEGLKDWDISRDGPYFGFKIPGEEDKYFYVWLDAPIGYIASTENYCKQHKLDALKDYWQNKDTKIIHFIGKDIIYFHFLFWPAMLINSGFNVPDDIIVHGFLTVNGEKMSKSRGTFFTAYEFINKFQQPEYLRYYYAATLSKKLMDINLDFKEFQDKSNNELVGNIANFCFRVLSFAKKNFDSKFIEIKENKALFKAILDNAENIKANYEKVNFKDSVKGILAISALGNKYFQDKEPWKLIKEDKDKTQKIIGTCINIVKILAIVIDPILPEFSKKIQEQLGLKGLCWDDINFSLTNHKISDAQIIIKKIEDKDIPVAEKEKKARKIKFTVSKQCAEKGIKARAAIISGVKIKKKHEGLEKLKKQAAEIANNIDLVNNPIINSFSDIYAKFNINVESPVHYLINLIKEKGKLPTINTAVDSYNIVAVKKFVSIGAHDIDKINGNVQIRITDGKETYTELGGKPEKVKKGEFAAVDDKNIVLCKLDIKQGEHTKLTDKSKNILVYVQGNDKTNDDYLEEALTEICDNIKQFCNGEYEIIEQDKLPFNLKVAKIMQAEPHPDADKLVVMQIDVGKEKRQIVAGVALSYPNLKQLVGKNIVLVSNLKKAELRGKESNGMLMAAEDKKKGKGYYIVLEAPKSQPGDQVYIDNYSINTDLITIDDFAKIKLKVKDKKAILNKQPLKTDKEEILAKAEDNARIS